MLEAQKKRWAAKKATVQILLETAPTPKPRNAGFTAAGRQRLAEAMKHRWAVKRAATSAKKTPTKKRATAKTE